MGRLAQLRIVQDGTSCDLFGVLFVWFKISMLSKQPVFQHGADLHVVLQQRELTVPGYPRVPRLGELLWGAAWDSELGFHRSVGLEGGLY